TTFDFLDNHIKNGDLTYQELDPISGLLNGSPSDKTFLIRRGRIAVEKDSKYSRGISGLLGYYVPPTQSSTSDKTEAMSSEEVTSPAAGQIKQIQKKQVEQPAQKKGLFQRLFNF
ncbi:MAG: hypothetical protein ACRC5W_02740, partial [Cetobacterium sp.]